MTALFAYQEYGAAWLAGRTRALLADTMGLGKSAQAAVACKHIGAKHIAIVCPASLQENWKREFARFWPNHKATLHVCSYEGVVRGKLSHLSHVDVLICDEAHYLKERTSKRTKAIFGPKCNGEGGLMEKAARTWLLTGTPAPNGPHELWPMLRALAPETINGPNGRPMPYWDFVYEYCIVQDSHFGAKIIRGKNLPKLRAAMQPIMLRRQKEEVLRDLPPLMIDVLPLSSDEAQKALRKLETSPEAAAIREALEKGGGEGLEALAPHIASLRRATGLAKAPAVAEFVAEWLSDCADKIVLFAHHKDVMRLLMERLKPFNPVQIAGGDAPDYRMAQVDRFQNDPSVRVFIGQIQAAGTGLTLTAASDLIFAEASWVPAENEQAAMRIHRIGQRNACSVRFATLGGSLDEAIQRTVARKLSDLAQIFS